MWDAFAAATSAAAAAGTAAATTTSSSAGAATAPHPLSETDACAAAWTAGEDLLEHLAVLYVLEAAQPAISRTKLDGLVGHYGYSPEGPATEYFRLHERLDVEHSRQARELIEELVVQSEDRQTAEQRMSARASAALEGNWRLLDGVEAHAAR